MKIVVIFFAAVCSVNDFSRADGSKVAVTLICENNIVGVGALNTGCSGGRSSVCCLDGVEIEVFISEYCAADGNDCDCAILNAELVNNFRNEPVNDTMTAAGAIMKHRVGQDRGFLKYGLHN